MRQREPSQLERHRDVHVEHGLQLLDTGVDERGRGSPARVVHEHVEATKLANSSLNHIGKLIRVGEVRG